MLIIHEEEVYESVENELFSSFQQIETVKQEPSIKWKKAPIPLEIWDDIKNICAFTNKEHNSECLIRLYYSPSLDKWATGFFKQQMSFMTVKDEFDNEQLQLQAPMEEGFVEAGSVHHHCSSGAFQSKTDESDEQNSNGLHITIGKLDSDKYELHSRFSQEGVFLSPNMLSFFEKPEWLESIPEDWRWRFSYTVLKDLLQRPGDPDKARKDWVKNIVPKASSTITTRKSTPYNRHSYYGNSQSHFSYDEEMEFVDYSNVLTGNSSAVKTIPEQDTEPEDITSMFEDVLNDIVYDTANIHPALAESEWDDITRAIKACINCNLKSAQSSTLVYMETMHGLLRDIIKDKQEENKECKKELTLTNFLSWINASPDDETAKIITDALIDHNTDSEQSGIPLLPVL